MYLTSIPDLAAKSYRFTTMSLESKRELFLKSHEDEINPQRRVQIITKLLSSYNVHPIKIDQIRCIGTSGLKLFQIGI
jgi:hypothetical protein